MGGRATLAARPLKVAVSIPDIPLDFVLFALTLVGVALFHRHTLKVALAGLVSVTLYKLLFTGFKTGPGIAGLVTHLGHEWVILGNLLGLLVGFALLAQHFHDSRAPELLPNFLPDDWKGGFYLLLIVFVLSSFLDNIAAAVIGGTMASAVFRGKVHLGYLAAIVAASNAGGSGSVVGDTTTTMMWIAGVNPIEVLHAYVAAIAAVIFFGVAAAHQQQRYAPIVRHARAGIRMDWIKIGIVLFILLAAIVTNVAVNVGFPQLAHRFPFIGASVWVALLCAAPLRRPAWSVVPGAMKGSVFLLSLVLAASMMPVEKLPAASWQTAFGLGFVSAVFDNIPLTALALQQGGYDWGMLAYTVGFGGSMIWFGSSAGVALSNSFPEARSVGAWLRHGWHVAVAYVLGFVVLVAVVGWQPGATRDAPVPRLRARAPEGAIASPPGCVSQNARRHTGIPCARPRPLDDLSFLVLPDVAVDCGDKEQMKPQVLVTGEFLAKCTGVKVIRDAAVGYNNIDVCIRSGYTRACVSRKLTNEEEILMAETKRRTKLATAERNAGPDLPRHDAVHGHPDRRDGAAVRVPADRNVAAACALPVKLEASA